MYFQSVGCCQPWGAPMIDCKNERNALWWDRPGEAAFPEVYDKNLRDLTMEILHGDCGYECNASDGGGKII